MKIAVCQLFKSCGGVFRYKRILPGKIDKKKIIIILKQLNFT